MDGNFNNNMEVMCCFCEEGVSLKDAAVLTVQANVNSHEKQQLFSHKNHLIEKLDKSIPLHPDFFEEEEGS